MDTNGGLVILALGLGCFIFLLQNLFLLLKHEEVWRKYEVQLEADVKTDVKTDVETVEGRKGK
jgi:hypothetical protein